MTSRRWLCLLLHQSQSIIILHNNNFSPCKQERKLKMSQINPRCQGWEHSREIHLEVSTAKPVLSVTKVINSSFRGEKTRTGKKQCCWVRFLACWYHSLWAFKKGLKRSREVKNWDQNAKQNSKENTNYKDIRIKLERTLLFFLPPNPKP